MASFLAMTCSFIINLKIISVQIFLRSRRHSRLGGNPTEQIIMTKNWDACLRRHDGNSLINF
jgi:hypothetical protein